MNESPIRPQPGWYPTPTGGRRYWDGVAWVDLPDPDTESQSAGVAPGTPKRSRLKWALASAGLILVLAVGGTVAAVVISDAREAESAAELAAAAAAEEAAAAEQVLAEQEAAEEAAAREESEALEAEQAAQQAERDRRERLVPEIEDSIQEMAEGHVDEGIVDGPVLEVGCSPVSGGSMEDLSQQTTVFECFVATEENDNGTYTGYYYNATMNWSTGRYTYGFGQP